MNLNLQNEETVFGELNAEIDKVESSQLEIRFIEQPGTMKHCQYVDSVVLDTVNDPIIPAEHFPNPWITEFQNNLSRFRKRAQTVNGLSETIYKSRSRNWCITGNENADVL